MGVSLNRQLIRGWQLEQVGRSEFVFRYVPAGVNGLEDNLRRIEEAFRVALGQNVRMKLQEVSEIAPSATGKIRWIINRWRQESSGARPSQT